MTERGEKRKKAGRDEAEFSPKTRELIARRAGYKCSMPDCGRLTVGPAREQSKSSCKGVACHIYAAAGRGPRGTGGLSEDERSLPENGIWLCSDHASLIDKNNGKDYPPGVLISYKALHEARVGRELGGIYSPLGWVQSLKVRSSPVFAGTASITFGKLTLLVGENATGKTALCEWLASVESVKPLERWQRTFRSKKRVSIEVDYLDPQPHSACVSFLNEDWPRYELDGAFSAVPATPVRIVAPGKLQFSDYDEEVDDLQLIADLLALHPYEILALCDEIPSKGTDNVTRVWFENEELGRVMHVDVKGTVQGLPFRGLSGNECFRVVMEFAIIAAAANSKKKRPFGQVGPVLGDGEIIASCARDAGTRRPSTQADASQERCLTPSRPRGLGTSRATRRARGALGKRTGHGDGHH